MASFCKQCSIETFGEDFGDFRGLTDENSWQKGLACVVLCEGCGPIQVDPTGNCLSDCFHKHECVECNNTEFCTFHETSPNEPIDIEIADAVADVLNNSCGLCMDENIDRDIMYTKLLSALLPIVRGIR